MMKILGIDPALGCLGWAVVAVKQAKICYEASGVVQTKNDKEIHKRLSYVTNNLVEIIKIYNPDVIAMEETFVNINAASSLKLAYVRGAIMALIGSHDKPYFEYEANLIKKTATGSGHADKQQVKHMVKLIISNVPDLKTTDEFDALAVAYTCWVLADFKAKEGGLER